MEIYTTQRAESTSAQRGDARFTRAVHRRYEIKELWAKHREISRQVMLGATNVAIADAIGCTPQTVSNVRNSPLGKAEIARLAAERDVDAISISQRIEEFAPVALTLIEQIVRGEVPEASIALRAKLASTHLARAGYGEVHKVQALHAHLTRDEIEAIKERALTSAKRVGMLAVQVPQDATV